MRPSSVFRLFEFCRETMSAMLFFQLITSAALISCVNFELEMVSFAFQIRGHHYLLHIDINSHDFQFICQGPKIYRCPNIHRFGKHINEFGYCHNVLLRGFIHDQEVSVFR